MEKDLGLNIFKYLSSVQVMDIISMYDEPHRFYHNRHHLNQVIENLNKYKNLTEEECDILSISVYFHDVVYNPRKTNDEQKSVDLLNDFTEIPLNIREKCSQIIMDTTLNIEPIEKLSKIFWLSDRNIFFKPFSELIEYENKIFKEYQYVSYDIYKEKRIEFLNNCIGKYSDTCDKNLESLITYVKTRKIRVGIYAGTFNPLTTGHLNIIEKSSKIFDKVIIAFGNNPEKESRNILIPECIQFYQIEGYDTLITDFMDTIENTDVNVTLIRGIRNGADLSYESNQVSFINDIRPNTNIIYIPCDKQYEHISSSAIRNLLKFNPILAEKYIPR